MTESITPQPEFATTSQITIIHNKVFELPRGEFLYDLEATRQQGFNGRTLVQLVLPTLVTQNSDEHKTLSLIDYGQDIPSGGRAILFNPETRTEMTGMGVIRSRYALIGVNYHSIGPQVGFLPLREGRSVTIGRDRDNPGNYSLGLSESGNKKLSGEHATITVEKSGRVYIEDHSLNGTGLILPS